jgi:tRNA(fMet)-specific endonuclease VapC
VAQVWAFAGDASAESFLEMIILDTDVFSLLELPDSPEYKRLRARIAQLDPPQPVTTTVITYEEQSRGRLATVNAARSPRQLAQAYAHLRQHVLNYRKIPITEFDEAAAETAATLQKAKLRLGTLDLRIAAIALTRQALLVSRNLRDFRKVPDLRVEDWTLA